MPFTTPVVINSVAAGRLYIGTNTGIYESTDQGNSLTRLSNSVNGTGNMGGIGINAIVAGGTLTGTQNPDVLYVGAGNNIYLRQTAGGTLNRLPAYTGGNVVAVTANSLNWQEAYVTDGNAIFQTINAGGVMLDITGTLLTTALRGEAGSIFSLAYVSVGLANPFLLAGTRRGIWASFQSSLGTWTDFNGGTVPETVVYQLTYDPTAQLVFAATMGRGAYVVAVPEPSSTLLAGLGALLFLTWRRRRSFAV